MSARALEQPSTLCERISAIEGMVVDAQIILYLSNAGGGISKSQNV